MCHGLLDEYLVGLADVISQNNCMWPFLIISQLHAHSGYWKKTNDFAEQAHFDFK